MPFPFNEDNIIYDDIDINENINDTQNNINKVNESNPIQQILTRSVPYSCKKSFKRFIHHKIFEISYYGKKNFLILSMIQTIFKFSYR